MPILISIGPALAVYGSVSNVVLGTTVTYTIRTAGATGVARLSIQNSTLPGEWSFLDNGDGTATLSVTAAAVAGSFSFRVRAVDNLRFPVFATFRLEVYAQSDPSLDPCAPYTSPSSSTGLVLEIGDNTALDAIENVTTPTGGTFEICEEIL